MIVSLSINFANSFKEVSFPPNPFLKIFRLKKIFILLNKFLRSQVTIFIEQIDFQYLLSISVISESNEASNEEREEVSEISISDACGEGVIIVSIEPLK